MFLYRDRSGPYLIIVLMSGYTRVLQVGWNMGEVGLSERAGQPVHPDVQLTEQEESGLRELLHIHGFPGFTCYCLSKSSCIFLYSESLQKTSCSYSIVYT